MKKFILAICLAFLSVGTYASIPVKKSLSSTVTELFQESQFVRMTSKCGVSWSGVIYWESSWLDSIEIANFVDRLSDMKEAIDAACGTTQTQVVF